MMSSSQNTIFVVAIVFRDTCGRQLAVRKRGTTKFMHVGGKPEEGESPEAAIIREVREEIGIELLTTDLRYLGTVVTETANEPGKMLSAQIFDTERLVVPLIGAEIVEDQWFTDNDAAADPRSAPLLKIVARGELERWLDR